MTVLDSFSPGKIYGSTLLRVAQYFDYIDEQEKILHLATIFQSQSQLTAVGVTNAIGKAVGIVTRSHLFDLLGKPFGREILSRKTVADVMEIVAAYDMNENLFHVAEKIQEQMVQPSVHFFLLKNSDGLFRGIFSSKDLLTYLSKMTQEDIQLASQLQERLVKSRFSQSGAGWSVEAFSHSAKGLGGDFYYVIPLQDNAIFLALGDVSGKGVAASILTSLLWGIVQFYDYRKGLNKLLQKINTALIQTFHLEKYLTGIFMIYDAKKQEVTYADMGHGHSFIVRKGKARHLRFQKKNAIYSLNLPLGIDFQLNPQLFRFKLRKGDLLCFYTDGLIEQVNEQGLELGEEMMIQRVQKKWQMAERLPEEVMDLLQRHQGGIPRLDDVTWLQLQCLAD